MIVNRRQLIAASSVALAGTVLSPAISTFAATAFMQKKLPYDEDALSPAISARTVGLHYGKHHAGYFKKLNQLVQNTEYADLPLDQVVTQSSAKNDEAIFNQAAQAWNHDFYWAQFKGGSEQPTGSFKEAVERDFGGIDGLKKKVIETADAVFGTGWVWLVKDNEKLNVLGLRDAGTPLAVAKVPIVGIDVWEHAYYLDYENRRTEHVGAVFDKLVNWRYAGEQFQI
ncbi:superoxide dismutase [Phyllobacterium brassicacearum]|uniref:Superoxide dismutase n=1 Tax=Phyllobacterium brassicacearum TaxID=314235 RepID=A0A2P7BVB9_9HYPH|nr:superoxide dismutase [Phyllobacterium brassicacearum]PSH70400.1 superoxide dismutase [Phyllobacterium brassicacearum]TDQ28008.1 Fe-Mn family superoxide dismutase [Phyllobacterium brassicacearum]